MEVNNLIPKKSEKITSPEEAAKLVELVEENKNVTISKVAKTYSFEEQYKQLEELSKLTGSKIDEISKIENGKIVKLDLLSYRPPEKIQRGYPTEIPAEVFYLTDLVELNLCMTDIVYVHPGIGDLTNLRILHLDSNKFETLPAEIGNLTNLTALYLGDNYRLKTLPPEIGNLQNLEKMTLSNTKLKEFPKEISNLVNLKTLVLTYVELNYPIQQELKVLYKNGLEVITNGWLSGVRLIEELKKP